MQVILLPEVLKYLENLSIILYEKEYFSFEETALKYVMELYEDIITNLSVHHSKLATKYFGKYGKDMEYAVFKKNKQTSWYVFFRVYRENGNEVYQVRYITNNHVIAQYL